MKRGKRSEDVATESYVAQEDDASGTTGNDKKYLKANLCVKNWWPYTLNFSPATYTEPF
jgi:hypothetical protein